MEVKGEKPTEVVGKPRTLEVLQKQYQEFLAYDLLTLTCEGVAIVEAMRTYLFKEIQKRTE